ncbi:2612_t:CDS:2, partial [Acaulospora colombiana]
KNDGTKEKSINGISTTNNNITLESTGGHNDNSNQQSDSTLRPISVNNNATDRLSSGTRRDWRSGFKPIDEFLQEMRLEYPQPTQHLNWIPFEEFVNCNYVAKGGFSTIYEATWTTSGQTVSLKCLNDSQDISTEYLNELKRNWVLLLQPQFLQCYGITQQPTTGEFMMVMQYAPFGDLRSYLQHNQTSSWKDKVRILKQIARGISEMHKRDLVHGNLHSGNVVNLDNAHFVIADVGLCGPRPDFAEISDTIYHWLVDESLESSLRKSSMKSALKNSPNKKTQHPDAVYYSRLLDFPEIKDMRRRQYLSLNIPRNISTISSISDQDTQSESQISLDAEDQTETPNQSPSSPYSNFSLNRSTQLRNSLNYPPTSRDTTNYIPSTKETYKFVPPKEAYSFLSQPPIPANQNERSLNNPRAHKPNSSGFPLPRTSSHNNGAILEETRQMKTNCIDDQKNENMSIVEKHHSRNHTSDSIIIESNSERHEPLSTSEGLRCCDQSLVKELNKLPGKGNNYVLVRCPKHLEVAAQDHDPMSGDGRVSKKKKWWFTKKMFKKDKMNEKVICGVGRFSETVTVRRPDGKMVVVKRVDKNKLVPTDYYKDAHPGKCTCKSCQDHVSIFSFARVKGTVASDIVHTSKIKNETSPTKSKSSPALISFAENSNFTSSGIHKILDGVDLTHSPRNSLSSSQSLRPKYSVPLSVSHSSMSSDAEKKIPLELMSLLVHSTELPELICHHSNNEYYYYITKMHGVKQRKWKKPRSWFCKKYFDINWEEYIWDH